MKKFVKEEFYDPYCIIYDLNKYTLVVREDKATLFRKDVTEVTAEIHPPIISKED